MSKFATIKNKIKSLDIYGNRAIFFIIPLVVVLIMIICGVCYEAIPNNQKHFANIGIDFQGGTILTIEFDNEKANSADYKDNVAKITDMLKKEHKITVSRTQASGDSSIIIQYTNASSNVDTSNGDDAKIMDKTNNAIKDSLVKMSDNGDFGVSKIISREKITTTTIGNESSKNLLKTSAFAIAIALVLMLLYIIIRFDFYSGLAAVVALLHDVIILLSLTVIFYVEIGDSIVAGLITIVAYSINNTIVVFDRIRSTVKPLKKQGKNDYDIKPIINNAIGSTMTRTLYTTITTLVVMIFLVAIGVASIRTFGLPIIFGLIAGFYSSVFIAAPLWGTFKNIGDKLKIKIKNKKFEKQRKVKRA